MKHQYVSLAMRLAWTKYNLRTKSLIDILEIIKEGTFHLKDKNLGDYTLKFITEAIRANEVPETQNFWKETYVPVTMFNGIWDGTKICQYSNVTALDFDHIHSEDDSRKIMDGLMNTSCVVAAFRTFKKHRLKAIVLHDNTDPLKHKDMYEQLMTQFGLSNLDESCKDLSRKTYLVWDENIWINPSPVPFHYEPNVPQLSQQRSYVPSGKSQKSPHSIINILNSFWRKQHPEYWQKGNRAISIFKCACQFCEYGVPQDMAEDYFLKNWEEDDMTEDEIRGHVNGAYKSAKYGSKDFY